MSFTSYMPGNITFNQYNSNVKDVYINSVKSVKNGTVFVNDNFNEIGVYDKNGNLCTESILERGEVAYTQKIHKNIESSEFIDEDVLYLGAGYLLSHFGHFLVEGIARSWALLYPKYKKLKVVIAYNIKEPVSDVVRRFLNALGVDNENIIVVYKPTMFSNVFIPKQAMNSQLFMLPIMKRVFDKIASNMNDRKYKVYDKIYLSRSAIVNGHGCVIGEKPIEKIFKKNGYEIIYPEKLSLEHQITLAANCKEMAGTAGSALHLALFMKPGGRVIQIKRNSTNSDNINTQKLICDLCGLDLVWIYGSIETLSTEHYTEIPQIVGITPYLIKFFDDNNFKYDESDLKIDESEIARYKKQLHKYKTRKLFKKIVNVPVRLVSLIGITKHGRRIIREYLYKKFNV